MHAELLIMYALYCFRRQKQLPKVLNIYIDNYYLQRMNKRGFDCAISRFLFADSLLPLASFSLFLFSILPRLLTHFFPFFLYPIRSRATYLSHSSRLPVSLLHLYATRFSWESFLPQSNFYFTWLVRIPKFTYSYVFNACCTLHENMHRICGSLVLTGSELFSLLTCPHTTAFTLLRIFSPLETSSIKI